MLVSNAWDNDLPPEMAGLDSERPPWLDRLVDLHVLCEHGDSGATEAAGRWLSTDPEARRIWDEVQQSCDHIRAGTGPGAPV